MRQLREFEEFFTRVNELVPHEHCERRGRLPGHLHDEEEQQHGRASQQRTGMQANVVSVASEPSERSERFLRR